MGFHHTLKPIGGEPKLDQSITENLSSNKKDYRIVHIKIPKEFDFKGFAKLTFKSHKTWF